MSSFKKRWQNKEQTADFQSGDWSLKLRSELHLARRLYHFLGVLVIIGLYQLLSREQGVITICLAAGTFIIGDFLRLRIPKLNKVAHLSFGAFLRSEEMKKMSGMAYLLGGALVVIVFFPKPVGLLSFLFLALGDPISSVVGVLYGKDKILGNKSLQGTLAGFAVCTLIAMIYFQVTGIMADRLILVSLICGVIGALSELLPIWKMDDNFTMPVMSATLLYLTFMVFGGFN